MSDDAASESVDDRLAELTDRLDEVESDFDEKIEDVRERVIQVKRELDQKAQGDHEHENVFDRIDDLEAAVDPDSIERMEGTVEEQTERLDALEEKVDMLASSAVDVQEEVDELTEMEDVLDDQGETLEDLEERVEMLATSSLKLLDWIEERSNVKAEKEALDRLRDRANLAGVNRGTCEDCGTRLKVSLLTEPACPNCGATFSDVEAEGFLRSGELKTGPPPVSEDDVDHPEGSVDGIAGAELGKEGTGAADPDVHGGEESQSPHVRTDDSAVEQEEPSQSPGRED